MSKSPLQSRTNRACPASIQRNGSERMSKKHSGRQTLFGLLMAVLYISVVSALAQQQDSNFKPVASAKQLMEAIIIPASDKIFTAASEPPRSNEEWAAVKNSAIAIA